MRTLLPSFSIALLALATMVLFPLFIRLGNGQEEVSTKDRKSQEIPPPIALEKFPEDHAALPELLKKFKIEEDEELEYKLFWRGVPAGKAWFWVQSERETHGPGSPTALPVKMDIRTNRLLTSFYRVRNKARTLIDAREGFSRLFRLYIEEDTFIWEEKVDLDYKLDQLKAICSYPGPVPEYARLSSAGSFRKRQWIPHEVKLQGKVLDPLSAIYYLRFMDLQPNNNYTLPICTDRRVWNVNLFVKTEKEIVHLSGIGPRACLRVRVDSAFTGLFVRRGDIELWLDDRTKTILKAHLESVIGPVDAQLECTPKALSLLID